jgi:hypothetical protein
VREGGLTLTGDRETRDDGAMRRTAPLAWALVAAAMAMLAAAVVLTSQAGADHGLLLLNVAIATVFMTLGVLVATRHPRNPIGWLFVGLGFAGALSSLTRAIAEHDLAAGGDVSAFAKACAAYHTAAWILTIAPSATFLLLLFPTGRLLSPRYRYVAWSAGVGIALSFLSILTKAGPLEDFTTIENPFALHNAAREPIEGLGGLLVIIGVVGSVTSLVRRARRAQHEEREQIKWLQWAGSVTAFVTVVGSVTYDLIGETIANVAILTSIMSLPVAAGIAILKYRLYDIDVVINRTLVYAALSVSLAVAYFASVLLLQLGLDPLTQDSGPAVAGSTLAVAGLFRPAQARIQELVDRRFFRHRYDMARTLQGFSARVRDEVDLDALGTELQTVVRETMQPGHVSLWLKETA